MIDLTRFDIVLGSTSERRLQILKDVLNLDCRVIKPNFEENLSKQLSPKHYVLETSKGKLEAIIRDNNFTKPTIVICCDTIIDWQGHILEKPINKTKQRDMLYNYKQAPCLTVLSGLQVAKIDDEITYRHTIIETELEFDSDVTDDILHQYIASEEGLEVAGGFKYQALGNILFKRLQGDYFNVVGLPARATFQLIDELVQHKS